MNILFIYAAGNMIFKNIFLNGVIVPSNKFSTNFSVLNHNDIECSDIFIKNYKKLDDFVQMVFFYRFL